MEKDTLAKLVKYADGLKSRLSDPLPAKHQHRPATYKQFLQREIDTVNKKIEALKMSLPAPKK